MFLLLVHQPNVDTTDRHCTLFNFFYLEFYYGSLLNIEEVSSNNVCNVYF